jgi:hypothetical protein
MPLAARPTRTSATELAYRRRTRELVARCRRELGVHPHEQMDYRQFVGWLISHKSLWARTTWRQYKASVVYTLQQEAQKTQSSIAQEALDALLPVDVEGCVAKTRKTSGSKLKRFPAKDYRMLIQWMQQHPGQWHTDLTRWLTAALLTGLRPQEWAHAQWVRSGSSDALLVANAKTTNQRSHGPTRTLLLDGLTDSERQLIRAHIQRCQEWEKTGQFKSFYQGCSATLTRLGRLLWPGRQQYPTLYSARHQFSADAKASGFRREELAAMMGHAVDDTAVKHYGRKVAGHNMVRVLPDPAEVAKIRQVYTERPLPQPKGVKPLPSPQPDDGRR